MKKKNKKYPYKKKLQLAKKSGSQEQVVGKKEIKKAISEIKLGKEVYSGNEIDEMLLKYYGFTNIMQYVEATRLSNEFMHVADTYEVIGDAMLKRGYVANKSYTIYRRQK